MLKISRCFGLYSITKQLMTVLAELKRRRVIRVAVGYAALSWLFIEVSATTFPMLRLPDWAPTLVLVLLLIGFPFVLIFTWAYQLTPEGLKRDSKPATLANDSDKQSVTPDSPLIAVVSDQSIAVLPFVNMSDDASNEYFSDGLSEELLNLLARVPGLHVAARTSSFSFKGERIDVPAVAEKLRVANVLEGSVRKVGDKVRITAQLINAADGYHLWSETFDRTLDDIFVVQDEIARSVVDALKVRLLGEHQDLQVTGGTENAEAFQAYLLGVHFRNRGDHEEALRAAIGAFRKSIELDPEYAKPHVGLAYAWGQLAANSFVSYEEGAGNMEKAVATALALAPDLPDAYLARGFLLMSFKQDQHGALESISTALKLNPGNAEVQREYARINSNQGRHDEGITAARRSLDLDPVSLVANHFLGHVLYFARRYDQAIPVFRHVLEMESQYPKPRYFIAMSHYLQGNFDAAWEEIQQEPLYWMNWTGSALVLWQLGRRQEADVFLGKLTQPSDEEFAAVQRADIYAQRGDPDKAMENLQLAFNYGDPGLSQLLIDPFLDPLRDDPRFIALMARLGFERVRVS